MPLIKSWTSRVNFMAVDDMTSNQQRAKQYLWALYRLFADTGWGSGNFTLMGSSNRTTGAMDGVDRLGGAVFNPANFNFGNNGQPHTWFTYRNATSEWYITVSFNRTNWDQYSLYWSLDAPTGGTATQDPTFPGKTSSWIWYSNPSSYNRVNLHGTVASDGSIVFCTNPLGSSFFSSYFACTTMDDMRGSDNKKWAAVHYSNIGTDLTYAQCIDDWRFLSSDNTTMVQSHVIVPRCGSDNYDIVANFNTDVTLGQNMAWPMYLFARAAGQQTIKGRLQDLFLSLYSTGNGNLRPASAPYEGMIMKYIWVPFSSAPVW